MIELIVGQIVDIGTRNIVWTLAICMVFSIFYRENPIYDFIEHGMIGTMGAWYLTNGIESTIRTVFTPIIDGTDPARIIIIIAGISYFTALFGRRFAQFYRTIVSLRLGAMFGISIGASIPVTVAAAISLSQTAAYDPFAIIAVLMGVFTIFYFTFSKWTDTHLRLPRRIGYWVVFAYFAGFGVTMWNSRLEIMTGWVTRMSDWPAVLIPIAALGIILVDAAIRRGRTTTVEAR
jgi:hypothetical protein